MEIDDVLAQKIMQLEREMRAQLSCIEMNLNSSTTTLEACKRKQNDEKLKQIRKTMALAPFYV
jgi:hypothetical protein